MAKHHIADDRCGTTVDTGDEALPALRAPAAPADVRRRLLDCDDAAVYMGTSGKTILRLIQVGVLPVVKLPVERGTNGIAKVGVSRRVLIDVRDLDALIDRSKETRRW